MLKYDVAALFYEVESIKLDPQVVELCAVQNENIVPIKQLIGMYKYCLENNIYDKYVLRRAIERYGKLPE